MKIRKLTIKNLHSLRLEVDIDFLAAPLGTAGLFAITGDTGAGKSTILDAITLALFGKLPRGSERGEVLSFGATQCLAEVELENNNILLRARWGMHRSGGKIDGKIQEPVRRLERWNPEKEIFETIGQKGREVDQLVEELTGLDYDRFRRSVLLAQGDFAAFLHADERERSELLEKITGSEIYSELSKAAYLRYKAEDGQLKELLAEKSRLEILPPEEAAGLQQQVQEMETAAAGLQENIIKLRHFQHLFSRKQELENTAQNLADEQKQWEEAREAAAPEFARLQQFNVLRQYLPQLQKLEDWQTNQGLLQTQVAELEAQINQSQIAFSTQESRTQEIQKQLEQAQLQQKRQEPILNEALRLDIEIDTRSQPLSSQKEQLNKLELTKGDLQADLQKLEEAQQASQDRLQRIQQWLAEHPNWHLLTAQLPLLQSEIVALDEARQQKMLWEQDLLDLDSQLRKLQEELAVLQEKQQEFLVRQSSLHQTYQAAVPKDLPQTDQELINWLIQDLERLNQRQSQLEQLQEFNGLYRQLLAEINDLEQQLETLRHRELDLQKRLLNIFDEQEIVEETLQFKQQVYAQQRLIANYEQDREQLKEGEPCPLCFSTEHPFRHHHFKPFVDQSRQEYELALANAEILRQERQELALQMRETSTLVEQLEQPLHGQLGQKLLRITELEGKRGQLLGSLAGLEVDQEHSALQTYIADTTQLLIARRKTIATLRDLGTKILEVEKLLQQNQQVEQQLLSRLTIHQERQSNLLKNIEEAEVRIAQKESGLKEKLSQLDFDFQESSSSLIQSLLNAQDHFQKAQTLQSELSRELEKSHFDEQQKKRDLEKANQDISYLSEQVEKEQSILDALKQKRFELIAAEDIQILRSALELAISSANEQLQVENTLLKELREQVITAQTRLENLQKELKKANEEEQSLTKSLEKIAQDQNLDGITALKASMLTSEEEEQIRNLLDQFTRREAELQRLQLENANLLAEIVAETKEAPEVSSLKETLDEKEKSWQLIQQNLGQVMEKLNRHEQQQLKGKALFKSIQAQQKEYQRWAKLNDLIGSADGKKFRSFAQGLTLAKLVQLANRHLQQLNGRYVILKKLQEDLGLEIMDTFQANHRRSMRSLSGGESFLVSLALALALSELAGRNTSIQSLFIDEGFGTLDESSLDLAISTLENLQSSGKAIGIISHVKELKERIGVQIQVKKQSDGFSQVKVFQT